ncbi:uncharacterized protein LOC101855985 [Aplysia californica]|uniref:Uncharacterized protein LOC101855985 n=1 Tax=Aplysia californica TaxID=6500 RepID=A0ABM0JA62_APLCA|nr:uncharacterized protein LOC101855985 [Aplysia californica]
MAEHDTDINVHKAGETTVHRRVSLPSPKPFDGKTESWPRWRQCFNRFRSCTGLLNKSQSEQVSTLLYTMGEVADDILTTLSVEESTATYTEVIEAFDTHFDARKNIIFARAKFNKRTQLPGQSVNIFIQDLHRFANDCSYGALKDELIRDRIVVGVRDDDLSKQLQLKLKLTHDEAIQISRQAEARDESQTLVQSRVELVTTKPHNMCSASGASRHLHKPYTPHTGSKRPCGYFGRLPSHKRDACPAKSACVKLGLIARINAVHETSSDFKREFPDVFKGLGQLKDPYMIKLQEGVDPVCLYPAQNVAPHPLLPKVKTEIDRILAEGVISPVTEPTEWCSGMVVVPKRNGSVRICVDLTSLNKAVRREVHPLASIDEQLAKFAGSTVFTKLDATRGFWQIPLHPDSRRYTTFITPFGRFCFNRLPFGISSASEIFQKKMCNILDGLPGVICHKDDILIHASDQDTHTHNK